MISTELEIQNLYREAQALGRKAERARIVTWLRQQFKYYGIPIGRLADMIERGDHTEREDNATYPEPHIVEASFTSRDDAEAFYEAAEKLLHEMGERGTISLRSYK